MIEFLILGLLSPFGMFEYWQVKKYNITLFHGNLSWYQARNLCIEHDSDLATHVLNESGYTHIKEIIRLNEGQFWIGLTKIQLQVNKFGKSFYDTKC